VYKIISLSVAYACFCGPAMAASAVQCPVPAGFIDTVPPDIETEMLVDHTEEITVNRPLDIVVAEANRIPIEKTMHGTSTLPGVAGTHLLRGTWPEPGALRATCLTDGAQRKSRSSPTRAAATPITFDMKYGTTRLHKPVRSSTPSEIFSRPTSAMAGP